ncbi:MAG: serine/threonine-protein kinase [Myxococcaceae bacterium]
MTTHRTLDELWQSLGLDSLPPDAGTALDLHQTRLRDWDEATLRSGEHEVAPDEREDLPRLSLSPPGDRPHADDSPHGRDFVVTGLLGEGGMGRVLLARQGSLGRNVAVKVTRSNAGRGAIAALLHEASTTGSLEHPGIVPVYALASDEAGRPAVVMKRVDGVSWSMLLRNPHDPAWKRLGAIDDDAGRLDANVEILRQVCNAIAFAHARGVLHRDLKPSNVLIGEFGEVYVADWGIAIKKVVGPVGRTAALVGSPVYLAPEMVTGDDAQMDERTDVFLLGAVLHELLTGAPPWSAAELKDVLGLALKCEPRPAPATAPGELVAICSKAMQRDPARRFQSALEFRDALGGYLRHRGSVKLAAAAHTRLGTLLATLQSTAKDRVYPLLSECRFGFTQALAEWPENLQAREGLERCLAATADYELSIGRLDAARALIAELLVVPLELQAKLDAAQKSADEEAGRRAKLEHLSRQLDPTVSVRQRVQAYAATSVGIVLATSVPFFFPAWHERMLRDRWYLTYLMLFVIAGFLLVIGIWRRALLETRLNRRVIGMVAASLSGVLVDRVVCALSELSFRQTIMQNMVLVSGICVTGGITLHSGFYWGAASMLLALVATVFHAGNEAQIFGVAAVGALGAVVLSWRKWRPEIH